MEGLECLIIDNYKKNIDEKLFYSILNHSKQLDNFVFINSIYPLNKNNFILADLQSRINSFIFIGIELPTDDLLHVIISKSFSEKQIFINPKVSDYIIKMWNDPTKRCLNLLKILMIYHYHLVNL